MNLGKQTPNLAKYHPYQHLSPTQNLKEVDVASTVGLLQTDRQADR